MFECFYDFKVEPWVKTDPHKRCKKNVFQVSAEKIHSCSETVTKLEVRALLNLDMFLLLGAASLMRILSSNTFLKATSLDGWDSSDKDMWEFTSVCPELCATWNNPSH